MIVKLMMCFSFFPFASFVKLLLSFFVSLPLISPSSISKKPPGVHDKIIDFSKIMTVVDGALCQDHQPSSQKREKNVFIKRKRVALLDRR